MAQNEMKPEPASRNVAPNPNNLSEDLLIGADAIADFLFGDPNKRRQVYHLAQTNQLPIFKLGASLCARRSTLLSCIQDKEKWKGAGD